jgi:F0F1-type ATP synthase assembly protein I
MGNIKEAFGIIDGYEMNLVGKLRLKKEELFEEIKKKDKDIIEKCKKVLENGGNIYSYEKDKKIKALYVFEKEKRDNENVLVNKTNIYTKEIDDKLKVKLDERIKEELKEKISLLEYKKVYINDEVMQLDPKKSKKEIYLSLIGGALLGFIFGWFILEDIFFGIIWAVVFAGIFSSLDVVVSTKPGRKKKK